MPLFEISWVSALTGRDLIFTKDTNINKYNIFEADKTQSYLWRRFSTQL